MNLKDAHTQKSQALKERENSTVYQFQPSINENSKFLSPRYFDKTEDLLLLKAQQYKERLALKKAAQSKREMEECTFVPKVINMPKTTRNTHSDLHSEAEKRRQKQELNSERSVGAFSFHPSINKKIRQSDGVQVEDRLLAGKKKFEEKMEKARKEKEKSETVSVPSKSSRNINVFEHLYQKKDD